MIISGLLGNETAEKTLLFIESYGSAYPRQIAKTFNISISPVQNQLERFEREGILSSHLIGKTRVYEWNPRYAFLKELRSILLKALNLLPQSVQEHYFRLRTRPRRKGKPLP